MAPKKSSRGPSFSHPFRDPAFYVDFMLILVTIWHPFGSSWLPLVPFGRPYGTLWLPFGYLLLLLAPFGALLVPFSSLLAAFWYPPF